MDGEIKPLLSAELIVPAIGPEPVRAMLDNLGQIVPVTIAGVHVGDYLVAAFDTGPDQPCWFRLVLNGPPA